jgi:formylglycine-generating enzyme required for sulfatase activity
VGFRYSSWLDSSRLHEALRRGPIALLFALLAAVSPGWTLRAQVPVPEMVQIPAGSFLMGSEEGASWEKPVHKVEVSEFWIGRRPVTLREFRAFRAAHPTPGNDAAAPDAADAEQPAANVSWEDAAAYCRWLAERTGQPFRLPAEAEWERAVRGGLEQKKYPWGDDPPVPADRVDDPTYRPAPRPNAIGVEAAHRNLWEWTADWYDPEYYKKSPEKDPPGPANGQYKVLRGGGYRNDPNSVFTWNRGSARPRSATEVITFRVARGEPVSRPAVSERRPPAAIAIPSGRVVLSGVQVLRGEKDLSIRLTTSSQASFKTMQLENPNRFVIDVTGGTMELPASSRSVAVNHLGVLRIRAAQFATDPPVARVVIDAERRLEFTVEAGPDALQIRLRTTP